MEKNKVLFKIIICFALLLFGGLITTVKATDEQDKRCYLSDISYVEDQSSAASGHLIKLDKNDSDKLISLKVDGKPQTFIKGICAWATSKVVYDLNNYNYDYFTSYIGVDESEQSDYFNTGVKFIIETSKDGQNWETKLTSDVFYGWSDAKFIQVDIKDAKYLKLSASNNSPNWWAEWYDEAIYADAKLVKAGYEGEVKPEPVDFIKTVEEYDAMIRPHVGEEITGDYELNLLKRELVKNVGYDILQSFVNCRDDYKETVQWLMSDVENLRLYILGGEPDGNYISSLQVLTNLYTKYKDDLAITDKTDHGTVYGELYKKMMITLSLTHSAQVALWMDTTSPENQSDAVRRYEIYKQLHKEGKFVVSSNQDHTPWFEDLKVEEMRYVLNNIIDDEEILWLNEYTQKRINANPGKEETYLQPHPYMKYIWPDYGREEFHDVTKKDYWDEKYEYPFRDYGITYKPGVIKLWMNIEGGAVCGGISKIGSNIRGVHGTPSSVISQPGHAALIYYRKDKDNNGYWTIDNDVSGWAQSGKTEKLSVRMPLGWGSDSYVDGWAASYIVLAQEALNHFDEYEKATKTIMTADLYKDDLKKQEEIYRKALDIEPINIDAWDGLIELYKKDNTKKEEDYYKLAQEICENLKCYPLPMYNLTNQIKPMLTSTQYTFKFTILQGNTLTEGSTWEDGTAVYQPAITRTVAKYLLGEMDNELATFSFDGEDAGKIVLSDRYDNTGISWDYSIDGKTKWNQVSFNADQEHKETLSEEQINSLTTENGIYVHVIGTGYEEENLYKIEIQEQKNSDLLYANDLENRVVGVDLTTQWRYSDGEKWTSYSEESPDLTGDKSVQIRQPATGTMLASQPVTYTFTENKEPNTRAYVPVSHLSIEKVSTEEPGHNGAASNAIDGNYNTRYHSNWSGQDTERYMIIKVDVPIYLSAVEFVPAGGGNGKIEDGTIYGSMDGENWVKLAENKGLKYEGNVNDPEFGKNPNNIKKFEVEDSQEVKYIKIVADKTNGNWFAARMFNIYQDLEKNPHITAGVAFSPSTSTTQNVEARLVNPSVEIEITNNNGSDTYEFKDNGTFTFEFTDKATHTKKGTAEARVDWIDREAPTATIKYSTENETHDEVVAELIPSEGVTVINNSHNEYNNEGKLYTFDKNGEFTFEFKDAAGNLGKQTAKVTWIKSASGHPDEYDDPTLPEGPGTSDPTPGNPDDPSKPDGNETIKSDKYTIEDNYVSKIASNTTVEQFKENIEGNQEITFIDKDGNVLEDNAIITTDTIAKLSDNKQYTLIVTGDIDCDGEMTINDLAQMKLYIIDLEKLSESRIKAANLDDDTEITINDLAKMKLELIKRD